MKIKTTTTVEELMKKIFVSPNFGEPLKTVNLDHGYKLIIFEEYTFRGNNYMTITVLIEDKEDYRIIHYVPSGSGSGLLGLDMGAAKSRIRAFPKFFQKADLPYEVILDY